MKPSMHGENSSLGFIEAVCLTKVLKDDTPSAHYCLFSNRNNIQSITTEYQNNTTTRCRSSEQHLEAAIQALNASCSMLY